MIWTDIADWRGPTVNQGGTLAAHRGLVVHIAEGSFEGTITWCRNPAAKVSAHFVVARDGRIAQLVDTAHVAWCQKAGNASWLSVECEGRTPNALSDAQVSAIARILAKCHAVYDIPLQVTSDPTGCGLGHHSMGGIRWGHQDCPGPAIIAQKGEIVRQALMVGDSDVPDPEPYWPGRYLRLLAKRMKGVDIRTWQQRMKDRGWSITADGIYGPTSADVCRQFQQEKGLVVDGIVGPVTWSAAWSSPVT